MNRCGLGRLARYSRNFSTGDWATPHPWLLTFLPGSAAEQIAGDILDGLTASDLGQYRRVTFYPVTTGQITTPFFRLPDEDIVFPFNLIRFSPADRAQAQRLIRISAPRAILDHHREVPPVDVLGEEIDHLRVDDAGHGPTLGGACQDGIA